MRCRTADGDLLVNDEQPDRPNILIIHADQHRADCLGAYGNTDIRTPNIDALGNEGVRYDRSYCPFPVCTPSRYSLLCGQYVHQHLGWTNRSTLPPGIPTFPRVLRDAGYHTRAVGKMHFTPTYLDVGFEEMTLSEQDGPGRFDDDYHRWLRDEGLIDRIDLVDQRREYREQASGEYWSTFGAMTSDLDEEHHSTTWIAERAMESLEDWSSGGNLLMVGFIKPHHPFDPPAPWDSLYDPDSLELLPGWTETPASCDLERSAGYFPHAGLTETSLRRVMASYYASISQIDHHVGRFIARLKEQDAYDNTLIVYTSDHGDYMGYHHLLLKGNYMYEPLVRVPLLIKYPNQLGGGTASDALVNNIDLAPTLLSATGSDVPACMQGHNLADEEHRREFVFAEGWGGGEYMVRSTSRKLLACRESGASQFFDLEDDPYELINRIDDPGYAAEIDTMRDELAKWALFDAPSEVYVDHQAPTLSGDNVPDPAGRLSEEMSEYFRRKMASGANPADAEQG